MKKCLAIAALLLASTAAQAQYTFEYGGRTIRIDPDRGTVSIPGVYDNTGRASKRSKTEDNDRSSKQDPAAGQDRSAAARRPIRTPLRLRPLRLLRPNRRRRLPPRRLLPPLQQRPNRRPRPRLWRPPIQRRAPPAPQAPPDTAPPPAKPAPAPTVAAAPPAPAAGTGARHRSGRQFAARRLADRGEGRQGPHRAMRRQSVRLFRRQEVEPEWRAGADQHEARQGQMERPDPRSEYRQHLRFHDRDERLRHLARAGLRLWRRVLRRPDLDARELSGCPLRCARLERPRPKAGPFGWPSDDHHGAIRRRCETLPPSERRGPIMRYFRKSFINHAPSAARRRW